VPKPRSTLVALGTYAGLCVLLALPFIGYVQWATGIRRYLGNSVRATRIITRDAQRRSPVRLDADPSQPLLTTMPVVEPRVTIIWSATATESVIRAAETHYGLVDRQLLREGVWTYRLTDSSTDTVVTLTRDPRVTDVGGAGRDTSRSGAVRRWLDRYVPIFRLRIAPGLLTGRNALAWFYYGTTGLPLLVLLVCGYLAWKRRAPQAELATMAAYACLCLVIGRALLAAAPDTRLADIACPTVTLGSWLAGRAVGGRAGGGHGSWSLPWRPIALAGFFAISAWSVVAQAEVLATLEKFHLLEGPGTAWRQISAVNRQLHLRPIDSWDSAIANETIGILGRYVLRCTAPNDRLLVLGAFAPEVYFYAERGFAGGQVHFMSGWHDSPEDQVLTTERLRRERVPIVLVGGGQDRFEFGFPMVAKEIRSRFVEVARSQFGSRAEWGVLVDPTRVPTGTDPQLGLPCFVKP